MRFALILLLALAGQSADAQLFGRRSTPITSYTARDGQIVSAQCSCKMCQDARAAAAAGMSSFTSGGRTYPIRQTYTAAPVARPVVQAVAAPVQTIAQAVRTVVSDSPFVSYANAYAAYEQGTPMIVLIGSPSCIPCQEMKRQLRAMKNSGELGSVSVVYLDSQSTDASSMMRGRMVPQTILYRADRTAVRWEGFQQKSTILTAVRQSRLSFVMPELKNVSVSVGSAVESVDVGHSLRSTPRDAIDFAVMLARVREGDRVFEPGCGDAAFLRAAIDAGATSGFGVEFNKDSAKRAIDLSAKYDAIQITAGDMFAEDYREADVVFLYHHAPVLFDLVELLSKQLKPGTRVVSYQHDMPNVCTTRHRSGDHTLFLWVVGDEPQPTQLASSSLFGY